MSEEESVSSVSEESAEEFIEEESTDESVERFAEEYVAWIEEPEWQELKQDSDYEICVNFPHQIRKKSNGRILMESNMNTGYLCVRLNEKTFLKHRLIALQFISNPDNLPQVDHINRIRTDNRIENLRWCNNVQNSNNRSKSWIGRKIEYTQELPDEVIVVNQYHQYHFEGYYFANDVFYKDTGNGNYRLVPWIKHKNTPNSWQVSLTDTNTITRTISKGAFYHIYGLN